MGPRRRRAAELRPRTGRRHPRPDQRRALGGRRSGGGRQVSEDAASPGRLGRPAARLPSRRAGDRGRALTGPPPSMPGSWPSGNRRAVRPGLRCAPAPRLVSPCGHGQSAMNGAARRTRRTAVSRESWQSRLLSGLSGLGGWLVGPDRGLNRLRTVLCATLTIAGAIGAEWLFVRFTGALTRPAPPVAAGAAAVAQVAAANRAVVIFAIVLGGIAGLIAAISVHDTSPRDQVVSMLFLPLPMIAVLDLSLAVGGDRVLALCLLPVILAAVTYLRRFGTRGVRAGPVVFAGYLTGFLLRPVIALGDTGWLTAEIGVGIVVATVVK